MILTELYIDALLVDEELADLVWEAWDAGVIAATDNCLPGNCLADLSVCALLLADTFPNHRHDMVPPLRNFKRTLCRIVPNRNIERI